MKNPPGYPDEAMFMRIAQLCTPKGIRKLISGAFFMPPGYRNPHSMPFPAVIQEGRFHTDYTDLHTETDSGTDFQEVFL